MNISKKTNALNLLLMLYKFYVNFVLQQKLFNLIKCILLVQFSFKFRVTDSNRIMTLNSGYKKWNRFGKTLQLKGCGMEMLENSINEYFEIRNDESQLKFKTTTNNSEPVQ